MEGENALCQFCKESAFKYVCPRCNIPYCSVGCYQSPAHLDCSEAFYKESVQDWVKSEGQDPESRNKMMEILQRANQEDDIDLDDDSDDEACLTDRLGQVDLDDADEVWDRLLPEEKREFLELIKNGDVSKIIPEWEPWWEKKYPTPKSLAYGHSSTQPDLVRYIFITFVEDPERSSSSKTSSANQNVDKDLSWSGMRPQGTGEVSRRHSGPLTSPLRCLQSMRGESLPMGGEFHHVRFLDEPYEPEYRSCCPQLISVPAISTLTKAEPSPHVYFNVVNVLASYVITCRYLNGDTSELAVEGATTMIHVSKNLSSNEIFPDFELAVESVNQSVIDCPWITLEPDANRSLSIKTDVIKILEGPNEEDRLHYVKAALSDAINLIKSAKSTKKKQVKGKFFMSFPEPSSQALPKCSKDTLTKCAKKLEFYLSWTDSFLLTHWTV